LSEEDQFLTGEGRLAFFKDVANMFVGAITDEIRNCDFGDARLNRRLQLITQRLSEKPNMSIPSACHGRAEMEAAYRFFDNDKVTPDEILASHAIASVERVRQTKVALLVQDTTEVDVTRPDSIVIGAGPLNTEKQLGALYHPLIAYEPSGIPLGTVWHKRWIRESIHKESTPDEKHKARKKLPIEAKESIRWIEGFRAARGIADACPDTLCACIGDSEADIYELFAEPRSTKHGQVHLIVRICYDRVVNGVEPCKKLMEAVRLQPVIAEQRIDISKREQKHKLVNSNRKKSRDARTATVSIRAMRVTIARPSVGCSTSIKEVELNVVLVEESNPPEGEAPIQWCLLTTLPIQSLEQVQDIIDYYSCRWQIEIYFRTFKSGCRIEERYFERYARLENCLAIYAIIAWRILYLCRLSEECPNMCCEIVFSPSEWKPVVMLLKNKVPKEPPRLNEMVKMVASLGATSFDQQLALAPRHFGLAYNVCTI
jgi:hypothetical protein